MSLFTEEWLATSVHSLSSPSSPGKSITKCGVYWPAEVVTERGRRETDHVWFYMLLKQFSVNEKDYFWKCSFTIITASCLLGGWQWGGGNHMLRAGKLPSGMREWKGLKPNSMSQITLYSKAQNVSNSDGWQNPCFESQIIFCATKQICIGLAKSSPHPAPILLSSRCSAKNERKRN